MGRSWEDLGEGKNIIKINVMKKFNNNLKKQAYWYNPQQSEGRGRKIPKSTIAGLRYLAKSRPVGDLVSETRMTLRTDTQGCPPASTPVHPQTRVFIHTNSPATNGPGSNGFSAQSCHSFKAEFTAIIFKQPHELFMKPALPWCHYQIEIQKRGGGIKL